MKLTIARMTPMTAKAVLVGGGHGVHVAAVPYPGLARTLLVYHLPLSSWRQLPQWSANECPGAHPSAPKQLDAAPLHTTRCAEPLHHMPWSHTAQPVPFEASIGAVTPWGMHGWHAARDVAPTEVEKALPALTSAHDWHALSDCAPRCSENLPVGHGEQTVELMEDAKKPATHAVQAALPRKGAYEPVGQGEQRALPGGDENPGGHGAHTAGDAPPGAV